MFSRQRSNSQILVIGKVPRTARDDKHGSVLAQCAPWPNVGFWQILLIKSNFTAADYFAKPS